MFRKLLFWTHLITGVAAGLVILLMSVTGVLLTYEKQIVSWSDRSWSQQQISTVRPAPVPTSGSATPGSKNDVEQLLAAVTLSGSLPSAATPPPMRPNRDATPSSVTLRSGVAEPVTLSYGRESVLLDPATGRILGAPDPTVRAFFRSVTDWHRWLGVAAGGEGRGSTQAANQGANNDARQRARAITGASNLAFLFLVMSGLYLWFPRKWRWPNLRAILWFRGGLSGKARDFNWHNTAGFWCCVPLFVIVLSGVVMSYPWANNLVYTLNGVQPPARGNAKGGPNEGRGRKAQSPEGKARVANDREAKKNDGRPARERPRDPAEQGTTQGTSSTGLNTLLAEVRASYPAWRSITITLPKSDVEPVTFSIDQGSGGQPQLKSTVTLARTGQLLRRESFSDQDAGRRTRSWMRFAHTGEYYGLPGQTIAGLASLGGALLVWTGFALAWRRFRTWQSRDHSHDNSRSAKSAQRAAA